MKPDPADLLPAIEIETGPHPLSTVLWLHGLGAHGSDFVPIVDELPLSPSLPVRFIFPHAPMRPVSINRGMVMRAWFDYDEVSHDAGVREDIASLRQSQLAVDALITQEKEPQPRQDSTHKNDTKRYKAPFEAQRLQLCVDPGYQFGTLIKIAAA